MTQQPPLQPLKPIDRNGLILVGTFLAIVLVAVFVLPKPSVDVAALTFVEERSLVFTDLGDDRVEIRDASTNSPVLTLEANHGGFTRTALRAISYNRRLHQVAPDVPVVLGKTEKGRIFLIDPSTEKSIAVSSFGDSNADQLRLILSASSLSS